MCSQRILSGKLKKTKLSKYTIERSNIINSSDRKSMIGTFTLTHIATRKKFVFNNIYLAIDNREAFLIFPFTNEEVYINRDRAIVDIQIKEDELKATFVTNKNH